MSPADLQTELKRHEILCKSVYRICIKHVVQITHIPSSYNRHCFIHDSFAIKSSHNKFCLCAKHKTIFLWFAAAKIASSAHEADTNKGPFQGEWIWESTKCLELNYLQFKSMNDNTYLKWISSLSNSVRSDSNRHTISYV